MSAHGNYIAALQRLIEGKPQNVPKGSAINKDTVALEAGRKRGSIKKSRAGNAELITAIEAAAAAQQENLGPTAAQDVTRQKTLTKAAQAQFLSLKKEYELALTKIASLAHENYVLKMQIKELIEDKEWSKHKVVKMHETKRP